MSDFRFVAILAMAIGSAGLSATAIAGSDEAPVEGDYFEFDQAPRLISFVDPVYPVEARSAEIEGMVFLRLLVDVTGDVLMVTADSSTSEIFESPAVVAAEQWRFEPAQLQGQPARATIMVPIEFSLHPSPGSRRDDRARAPSPPSPPADMRSELDHVCQTALDTRKMQDRWGDPVEGIPFVVLRNRQLRQFGAKVAPVLERSGLAIPTVEREELGDLPYVEFTRIAIQGERASIEYEYQPARVSCAVELEWKGGDWKVKKEKVRSL
ncbi:MAG: energy transducer TonB, partial [Gemmatimonadetes bacterium]|nr:energy transducer TonB [Gemmatimonadota bacterium]